MSADAPGSVAVVVSTASARIVLSGEVDVSTNDQLVAAVHRVEDLNVPIEVDTQRLTFMDSSVIAVIAHLARNCPGQVTFHSPPETVRYLLELTQVCDLVRVTGPMTAQPASPASTL